MKKIGIFLLMICLIVYYIPVFCFATEIQSTESVIQEQATIDDNSAVANGSYSLDALNPLHGTEKLVDNIRAAIVYESNSQTLLYAWNPDEQMYPASLVKILTALLAIEKGELSDTVTVSQSAVGSVPNDAVSAKLLAGEKLSLEDLLYCLLTGSANDAAVVIAEHIAGSQNTFVDDMNRYAQEIGCTATQFTNAHGLHDDKQYTTARDFAKILNAAMENSVFETIFTADEYVVPATNLSLDRKLVNGNSMKDSTSKLYFDERVIGGRTGVTKDGRRCLATVAESNGMMVLSIVMGAESVYQEDGYSAISIGGYKETSKLLDLCLTGYKTAQILRADQVLRQIPVEGAQNDLLVGPQISISSVLPQDITLENLTLKYADKPMSLPIEKGQHVSDAQIWHGNMCVAEVPLYAMNELRYADMGAEDNTADQNKGIPGVIWVILFLVLAVLVVFFLIRFSGKIKRMIRRLRMRRCRQNRKRVR